MLSNENKQITPKLDSCVMPKICSQCEKPNVHAKGMCSNCYAKMYWKTGKGKESQKRYIERKKGLKLIKTPPKLKLQANEIKITIINNNSVRISSISSLFKDEFLNVEAHEDYIIISRCSLFQRVTRKHETKAVHTKLNKPKGPEQRCILFDRKIPTGRFTIDSSQSHEDMILAYF